MIEKLTAQEILSVCDRWRCELWPSWNVEQKVETYANGGPPPMESGDTTCEYEVVPLGYAAAFMQEQLDVLLDPMSLEPGFIKADYEYPLIKVPSRIRLVENAVNQELNKIVLPRLEAQLKSAAGRATVTGRSMMIRKSPNDWVPRHARLLHPADAGIDILDENFREWAIMDRLTLRDIEDGIKKAAKNGWRKEGLETLKLWILMSEAEKYRNTNSNQWPGWAGDGFGIQSWMSVDLLSLPGMTSWNPVDVYWYFRKNGTRTKDDLEYNGHEEVDLYCISRFGNTAAVQQKTLVAETAKYLTLQYDKSTELKKEIDRLEDELSETERRKNVDVANERLVFYFKSRFKSIEECLILFIDDARVSGDQKLGEVRGIGRITMPKLAMQEQLMFDLMSGASFAAQPHFTVNGTIGEEYKKQLARGGLQPWQAFPVAIQPMAKQNALTGFGPLAQAISMLDKSVAKDGNQQANLSGSEAEFASESAAYLSQLQTGKNRRLSRWLRQMLDRVSIWVGKTLCRPWPDQRTVYPCYQDAQRLRMNLRAHYGIHEDEWDSTRWCYRGRRLAGEMSRQEAIRSGTLTMQLLGPVFPSILPEIGREVLRAQYGFAYADSLIDTGEDEVKDQTRRALRNVSDAFVTGAPLAPEPMDDPMKHSQVAYALIKSKLEMFAKSGSMTAADQMGLQAVAQYAAQQIGRLPPPLAKQLTKSLLDLLDAAKTIPISKPQQDRGFTELDVAEFQLKKQNMERLVALNANNAKIKEAGLLLNMRKQGVNEDLAAAQMETMATDRASKVHDIALDLAEARQPQILNAS